MEGEDAHLSSTHNSCEILAEAFPVLTHKVKIVTMNL
jgi:hypothetical protein